MASKKAPEFPTPEKYSVEDVTVGIQNMRFPPPPRPPPGWAGGFTLPLSFLQKYDPYLKENRTSDAPNRPPPSMPAPQTYTSPQASSSRPTPVKRPSGPAMPTPEPYNPSSSDPSLSINTKPNRRSSYPVAPTTPDSDDGPTPPPPRRRQTRRLTGSDIGDVQCSGTTKTGKRCTRTIKSTPPISYYFDSDETDMPNERYCFQHRKEILSQDAFFGKPKVGMIRFSEWIPEYLEEDTRVSLRAEMEKPVSTADVAGYIYCFEIINKATPGHRHFKVGRAVNLKKRFGEWKKQCESKEQIMRGFWPIDLNSSLLVGKMKGGEPGPHCHRLEKLIHLELADLAKNTPYLQTGWKPGKPNANSPIQLGEAPAKTAREKREDAAAKMSGVKCPDCEKVHQEIFTFKMTTGKYEGREYEDIVAPTISKWGDFVSKNL
ncbi:hypothetical protein CPB86DRAFT_780596 [Serendipita vermifera]|nr:hypothetical protein CPB86DRAFT_780596 [Serendipita vermifera]